MLLGPAMLGWHSDTFHQIAGVEFFLPSGHYNPTPIADEGRGYTPAGPAYMFTWYPRPAVEVTVRMIYLYNWENPNSHYKSGQELNIDYGLGYSFTPLFQAGLAGYLYKQLTDDESNGQRYADGARGQAVAIGPFVRYQATRQLGLTFKWQGETEVKNRAEGNRFFFQFAYQFD